MAIRFHCKRCGRLLAIASRKAGARIDCPECGFGQTVPTEEAAAAGAMAESALARKTADAPPIATEYDDESSVLDASGYPGSRRVIPIPPPAPGPPQAPAAQAARPMPPGTILYRRRTLYLHGLLFLLLAVGAFVAGYFVGRGDVTLPLPGARPEPAAERVLVEGKLYYDAEPGKVAPDVGAVILALPAERLPEATLPIQGLRPVDPPPSPESESVREIENLGGAYERADDSGTFRIVLPEPGQYRVLLISRQTGRAPETDVDELDLSQISRYFHHAADLVGPYKYRWTLEEINADGASIQRNFGRDGEKLSPRRQDAKKEME
ncbi:MAG TPA: hypothetical protein VMY37_13015 [Thermoguttaceae bacterium]|nr:hypothetical protein [Thermoguttaceae bacterium]